MGNENPGRWDDGRGARQGGCGDYRKEWGNETILSAWVVVTDIVIHNPQRRNYGTQ